MCVRVCVCERERERERDREREKERWTGYPSTTVYHLVLLCLLIPLFRMGPSVYTMNVSQNSGAYADIRERRDKFSCKAVLLSYK